MSTRAAAAGPARRRATSSRSKERPRRERGATTAASRAASGESGSARSIAYVVMFARRRCSSRFRSSGACRRRSGRSPTLSPASRCCRSHWTHEGYHEAFHTFNFGRYTLNSAIIAGAITLSNLFLASLGGYAFARLKFPGREVLFMLVLGTLMIPDQLRLVPIYLMLVNWIPAWVGHLGWHDATFINRNGVILIQLVSATSLFLMRQYFLTIPRDLEEAAKLDGCGLLQDVSQGDAAAGGARRSQRSGFSRSRGRGTRLFWPAVLLQDKSAVHDSDRDCRTSAPPTTTFWPPLMAASVLAILPILRDLRRVPAVLRRGRRSLAGVKG